MTERVWARIPTSEIVSALGVWIQRRYGRSIPKGARLVLTQENGRVKAIIVVDEKE